MECEAIRKVRDEMGLTNVEVMVPFVRTLSQAQRVTELLAEHGLERGKNGLRIVMMCEVPSNAILAKEFLRSEERRVGKECRSRWATGRRENDVDSGNAQTRREGTSEDGECAT